jgi:histidine triad (HIT) family protein
MDSTECLFCKIVKKEIPAEIVFENNDAVAFKDIDPKAPVHLLVIPKKHYSHLHEIPPEESDVISGLFSGVSDVIRQEKLDTTGYRLVVNSGANSGQAVFHIHVHILAGRAMQWPPG